MKKILFLLMFTLLAMLTACTSSIHMSQVDVGNSKKAFNHDEIIAIEKSQKIF